MRLPGTIRKPPPGTSGPRSRMSSCQSASSVISPSRYTVSGSLGLWRTALANGVNRRRSSPSTTSIFPLRACSSGCGNEPEVGPVGIDQPQRPGCARCPATDDGHRGLGVGLDRRPQ